MTIAYYSQPREEYIVYQLDATNTLVGNIVTKVIDVLANTDYIIFQGVEMIDKLYQNFDPLAYIASHPDLIGVFGINEYNGFAHYLNWGIMEGRAITFSPMQYVLNYPDLYNVFGYNFKSLSIHYINNGYYEGRIGAYPSPYYNVVGAGKDHFVKILEKTVNVGTGSATGHLKKSIGSNAKQTIHLTESYKDIVSFNRKISDTIHLAELYKDTISFNRKINDAINISETAHRNPNLVQKEIALISDAKGVPMIWQNEENAWGDSIGTKSWDNQLTYGQRFNVIKHPKETVNMQDKNLKYLSKLYKEAIHISDLFKPTIILFLNAYENITVLDSLAKHNYQIYKETAHFVDSLSNNINKVTKRWLSIGTGKDLWTQATPHTYNNLGIPSSLTALAGVTFRGKQVFRLIMTPTTEAQVTSLKANLWNHGIYGNSMVYYANMPHISTVCWKPVNRADTTVGGGASNMPGWGATTTIPLEDGWKMSYVSRNYPTDSTDNKFWSFCCPSFVLGESITVDWTAPTIQRGVNTISPFQENTMLINTVKKENINVADVYTDVVVWSNVIIESFNISDKNLKNITKLNKELLNTQEKVYKQTNSVSKEVLDISEKKLIDMTKLNKDTFDISDKAVNGTTKLNKELLNTNEKILRQIAKINKETVGVSDKSLKQIVGILKEILGISDKDIKGIIKVNKEMLDISDKTINQLIKVNKEALALLSKNYKQLKIANSEELSLIEAYSHIATFNRLYDEDINISEKSLNNTSKLFYNDILIFDNREKPLAWDSVDFAWDSLLAKQVWDEPYAGFFVNLSKVFKNTINTQEKKPFNINVPTNELLHFTENKSITNNIVRYFIETVTVAHKDIKTISALRKEAINITEKKIMGYLKKIVAGFVLSKRTSINRCEDFSQWGLYGGATYDSATGEITLPTISAYIVSPMVSVDYSPYMVFSCEAFSTSSNSVAFPGQSGLVMAGNYFNENLQPMYNCSSPQYQGNGYAVGFTSNTWTSRGVVNCYFEGNVKYVRYQIGWQESNYMTYPLKLKLPMVTTDGSVSPYHLSTSLEDELILNIGKMEKQAISLFETYNRVSVWTKKNIETIHLTEAYSDVITFNRKFIDMLDVNDSSNRQVTYTRKETLDIIENMSKGIIINKPELLSVIEDIINSPTIKFKQTLSINDTYIDLIQFLFRVSETVTIIEGVTKNQIVKGVETIDITEKNNKGITYKRKENLSFLEKNLKQMIDINKENLILAEETGRDTIKTFEDHLGILENGLYKTILKNSKEYIATTDSYIDFISFALRIVESFSIGEKNPKAITRPIKDAFSIADKSYKTTSLKSKQTLNVSDQVKNTSQFKRVLIEILTVADKLAKNLKITRKEGLTLMSIIIRSANAVISDLYFANSDLTLEDFQSFSMPVGFEEFTDFLSGDLEYQRAMVKIILEAGITTSRPVVEEWKLNIDVPDITDRGVAEIPIGGIMVNFNRRFFTPPEVIIRTTSGTGGVIIIPELSITEDGFHVVLNVDGVSVEGSISWVAQGY